MKTADDQKLSQIISFLKAEYKPIRLFLYGSRAHETHHSESDYDFVMVLSAFESKDRYQMMSAISSKLWKDLNVEVQVWAYSENDFLDWMDEFSSIPETALNTGREIELG